MRAPFLPRPALFPNANGAPPLPFSAHHRERGVQWQCCEPKCNLHSAGSPGLLRLLACAPGAGRECGVRGGGLQGFLTAVATGTAGPRPDLPQLAVTACVFVHINISLPLIIHLANFKGALQSQLDVLGFYHIYILYFFSEACQRCIFKAFPSFKRRARLLLQGRL